MTTSPRPCKFARTTDPAEWDGQSSYAVAEALAGQVHASAVQRHRNDSCSCGPVLDPQAHLTVSTPDVDSGQLTNEDHLDSTVRMSLDPDGVEFSGVPSEGKLTNWDHIFAKFDLDPAEFEIVDDTVRASAYQQSKRLENGNRDTVTLFSYRARFRRKAAVPASRVDDLIAHIRQDWTPEHPFAVPSHNPVTAVVCLADWQLGKREGDEGTEGTVARILSRLGQFRHWLQARRDEGHNVERILLANLGDHTEAVQGSYASQTYSVDLNMRDQLTLALELNMKWLQLAAELAPEVTYAAALCNHGQWQRATGSHDSVTGDADNSTGFLGDQLATVAKLVPALAGVEFIIPRDEMITKATVSGVNVAMAHGHKISGKEDQWLAAQSQALVHREKFIPELWVTAHRHHAHTQDFGPYSRIQATTEDPGSKWIYDQKGAYSTQGTTVFLTGAHLPMKRAAYEVLA